MKIKKKCCRCGDMPLIHLNTGRTKLDICLVCWLGLAMAMEKDLNQWRVDPNEFMLGLYRAKALKKNPQLPIPKR